MAGPPFLTDDPEPTASGHWEIYAPFNETAGRGADFEGAAGIELNYGAGADWQLTLGLPIQYSHGAGQWHRGASYVRFSTKYHILNNEAAELQLALFPGITPPTASNAMGNRRVSALLPLWAQKAAGPWTIFGGGGYAINPGAENQNYWTGGVAVTRQLGRRLLLGVEADRQGADTVGGHGATSLRRHLSTAGAFFACRHRVGRRSRMMAVRPAFTPIGAGARFLRSNA